MMDKVAENLIAQYNYKEFTNQQKRDEFFETAKQNPERIKNLLINNFYMVTDFEFKDENTIYVITCDNELLFVIRRNYPIISNHNNLHYNPTCTFYAIQWSEKDFISMLSRDCLVKIFTFLNFHAKIACCQVSKKFRNAATQNLLWRPLVEKTLASCQDFVTKRPDLNFYNQFLYYSFGKSSSISKKEFTKMCAKFFLKPENEPMLIGLFKEMVDYNTSNLSLADEDEIVIWRPFKIENSGKKRKIIQPKFYKQTRNSRVPLTSLKLALYTLSDKIHPQMWITRMYNFEYRHPSRSGGKLRISEIRGLFRLFMRK